MVLISHNSEFTSTCCNETWFVKDGGVEVTSAYALRQLRREEEAGGSGS